MQSSSQSWETWQQFVDRTLQIDDHMPMSHCSRFGDDTWDFYDSTSNSCLGKSPGSFRINWHQYASTLPPAVLSSVKVLGFFVVHYPAALGIYPKAARKGLKPATYCKSLSDLLGFLELLCLHSCLPAACIHTLADFTLADIEKTLPQWHLIGKARKQLRNLLMALASPLIQPYLPSLAPQSPAVVWTKHDIATIDFRHIVAHNHGKVEDYGDKPLPDSLFCLLVNAATRDVLSFLVHLGRSPYTPLPGASNLENKSLSNHPDFGKVYAAFLAVKETRYNAKQKGESVRGVSKLWVGYKHQFNFSYQEVKTAIIRIQRAARYLLLQFTGLRFSEAVQLQTGCVQQLPSGEYVIRATVIKNRSINFLQGADYWIACPIVRDAIAVLEELTRFTHSTYLFASDMHSLFQDSGKPMTNKSFSAFLNTYLYELDEQRHYSVVMLGRHRFKGVLAPYWLAPHRLRHTLALHMSRAGLGIPFISLHLKHLYQAFKRSQSVPDVTLKYGDIGQDIFNNALTLQQAHREMVHAIYHPDAPITGPGAAEFKANRKVYFTGMLAAGWQEDEIMEHLVGRGVLMADVGLGYCQGRREIISEDGSKALPPCLGQLKCNPMRCKNAVISSSKIAIWVQVYTENKRRLQDPMMSYAWPEYRYFMEEAQQVLLHLGIKVEHL